MSTAASAAKKPPSDEHKAAAQHVAHEGKEQRVICQHRNQQRDKNRRDKNDVRCEPENQRTFFRHYFVLMKQLP